MGFSHGEKWQFWVMVNQRIDIILRGKLWKTFFAFVGKAPWIGENSVETG